MKLGSFVIAATALCGLAASSNAASYGGASDIASAGGISWTAALPASGGDFTDTFTFTLAQGTGTQTRFEASFFDWAAIYNDPNYGTLSLPKITFTLNKVSIPSSATAVVPGSTGTAFAGASFSGLTAGNLYTLTVVGEGIGTNTGNGSYYLGNDYKLTVAAIPEPETYTMLLAGLGLMGLVARRRFGA